jgi:hypothetical protein
VAGEGSRDERARREKRRACAGCYRANIRCPGRPPLPTDSRCRRGATYLTLPEAPGATGYPETFYGDFEAGKDKLAILNRAGHGIFVAINKLREEDALRRTASNVVKVRGLFVDLDGAPVPKEWPLPPQLIVETSRGRYQACWVTEGVPLDRFSELQIALAALFDGDPAVKDLARVMRVPGFVHWKREPFRSRLLLAEDRPAYTLDKMLDSIVGLAEELEKQHRTPIVTTMLRNAKERERPRRSRRLHR